MSKIKVLVVDDSPFIHKAVSRALGSDLFEICGFAKNGREGLNMYLEKEPDVVTMDVTMPVMDGLAAAREIMAQRPGAKIIMLSAMGDEEIISQARATGINHFLQKPFKSPELVEAIGKLCK
jgi:two-component system chemotaxis response regulator CheY